MSDCRWCGEMHIKGICPKVKAVEFADDGVTVKRVEFIVPRDLMPMNGWPMFAPAPCPQPTTYQPYPVPYGRPQTICGIGYADSQLQLQNSAKRLTQ